MVIKKIVTIIALMLFSIFAQSQTINFKKHNPCSFEIELPSHMKLKKMFDDSSPDYCDYEVKLMSGSVIMELHSLIKSRFENDNIKELYADAVRSSEFEITYKMVSSDYFVVSGIKKNNGNIVYWKRSIGDAFISDMKIEYKSSQKKDIEPYIGKISKSFTSD